MTHLIISRELPPSPHPPGGIGTYVQHVARLLAEAGETVHVIAQLWEGAPRRLEELAGGRLIIHRVPLDEPVPDRWRPVDAPQASAMLAGLASSSFPAQAFSWQASLLAESLIESEPIDCVEAQEWEAPLYYLLVRRAVGLGPVRRPPCIVHLHSPTEFIYLHNEWDRGFDDYVPAMRLEEYTIAAADGLLCPSRYLGRQVERRYGLEPGRVCVIPYPIGDTSFLPRDRHTWETGAICFVGRLELRKGVLEWVEAAASVCAEYPHARFEFIGSDTPLGGHGDVSVGQTLQAMIPAAVKSRFRFRGSVPRSTVLQSLASARAAVVPSRWENFPNSCIEAMGTGLPVIVSPAGGMTELIADGQSGWIADSATADALRAALRRMLDTPAATLADMGRVAATSVGRLCDNQTTLARHLEWRGSLVAGSASRSLRVPRALPAADSSLQGRTCAPRTSPPEVASPPRRGTGVVVVCLSGATGLDQCLAAISRQDRPFAAAAVVAAGHDADDLLKGAGTQVQRGGLMVVRVAASDAASAKQAGVQRLLDANPTLAAVCCIDAGTWLEADFVSACETVFDRNPDVAVVSSWLRHRIDGGVIVGSCPSVPDAWVANDTQPLTAIRIGALADAGLDPASMGPGLDQRDGVMALLAAGWAAVTYPAVLASRQNGRSRVPPGRYSAGAISLARFGPGPMRWLRDQSFAAKVALLGRGLRQPRQAARWVLWQGRAAARRTFFPRGRWA